MLETSSQSNRRFPRVVTPKGVWVAWQHDGKYHSVCRVCDLNIGGVFVSTQEPVDVGAVISLLFSVPEGEIRAHAVVRNVKPGEGMGVQFTALGGQDTARLRKLLERLLSRATNAEA